MNGSHDLLHAEGHNDYEWETEAVKKAVVRSYLAHSKDQGTRFNSSEIQVGKALNKLVPGLQNRKIYDDDLEEVNKRVPAYIFPELDDCRDAFDKLMGTKTDWENGGL
jgi:hypothetical protein